MCACWPCWRSVWHKQLKERTWKRKEKTIRLVYPAMAKAGHVHVLIPEIKDTTAASQGYVLGAQLLNFLAPASNTLNTHTVPVSMAPKRKVQDGVYDRDVIAEQTHAAIETLKKANPDRIVTLGGECSVEVWLRSPIWQISIKLRCGNDMDRCPS